MKRKLLAVIGTIGLAAFLLIPSISVIAAPPGGGAGVQPSSTIPDRCTIKTDFSIGDTPFTQGMTVGPSTSGCDYAQDDWGIVCLINTLYFVTNWVFYFLMLAVIVMVLVGAFYFLVAAGDTGKIKKAGMLITSAIIALIVGLLAKAIPIIAKYITGMGV